MCISTDRLSSMLIHTVSKPPSLLCEIDVFFRNIPSFIPTNYIISMIMYYISDERIHVNVTHDQLCVSCATTDWLVIFVPVFSLLCSSCLSPHPPSRVMSGYSWWPELGLSVGQSSCQSHQDRPRGLRSRNSRLPAQREKYIITWHSLEWTDL